MPPEASTPENSSAAGMEDCIPLEALAMPDESEQMQSPAVGDKVQYGVEGEITRIEGENAYVKKTAVNGQKVAAPAAPKDDMAELESQAQGMSGDGGGY